MTNTRQLRYLLFLFSFVFYAAGVIILSFSVYVKVNAENNKLPYDLDPILNMVITIGSLTLVFGLLGCFGVIRESRCLLVVFFVALLGLFLMMVFLGIFGVLTSTKSAQQEAREYMRKLLPLSQQSKEVQESVMLMEETKMCCGLFNGHSDWGTLDEVSPSCNCTDSNSSCIELDGHRLYTRPCMKYIMTWWDRLPASLAVVSVIFCIKVILGMFLLLRYFYKTLFHKEEEFLKVDFDSTSDSF